jgi:antirestriction protein
MGTAAARSITTETPRIYVACLAAYNSGILYGAWIDVGEDAWTIWDGIAAMLAKSPVVGAEEWAIHDYEGFGGIRISEYEGIERVAELAGFIAVHGELGAELYSHFGNDLDEAREAITDRYHGCYARLADYMEELTTQSIAVPLQLAYYIDYEAMARDAEMSGDVFTVQTAHDEVHVFAGC